MKYVRALVSFFSRRKQHYQLTFAPEYGKFVLADLAVFCRAAETCYHDDPRKHAVLEGRREVFLRIQDHLQLTPEQLYALYARRDQPKADEGTEQ